MAEAGAHPACDLCGLDCSRGALERQFDAERRRFCCLGCMNVYAILLESGVLASGGDFRESELYQQSLKLGLISTPDVERPAIPADAETREILYRLSGLWCASCAWLIERALEGEYGVANVEVMFASDLLRVRYCPQYLPPSRILECVASLGYRASEYSIEAEPDRAERRGMLLRIGVAFFLWMNVMLFSLPIYASYWEPIGEAASRFVPFVLLALTTPAVFYSAWPILRIAALGLRQRTLRMEALLALGILAAYFYSAAQAFLHGRHYYFDTACAIVTLVLLGKLLERGAKLRTSASITTLYRMMPNKARVLAGGRERFVTVEALQPGMVFVVKAGERIPADGIVVSGSSHLDESVLTGESAPRLNEVGSTVACGSLNVGGVLEVRATRTAAESTLSHMIKAVEAALTTRSRLERRVDRVARVFVPVVMLIAACTVAGGLARGLGTADAVMRGIAVLVIACPCALGVATPLAVTAAVGAASRRGILVADSRVLETIRAIDMVMLDKTGTITRGDFRLLEADPAVLSTLAALEFYSEHPLGAAVVARAKGLGLRIEPASAVQVLKGLGITGEVSGTNAAIGSRRLMAELGVELEPDQVASALVHERMGRTVAWWNLAGRAGLLVFGDELRPDARALVESLHSRGIRVAVVSGDSEATTDWAASSVGADQHHSEATPGQKAEIVESFQREGRTVAMLGDGVNDAPALAAARLGIAMGSGTDLAMQASTVVLMGTKLSHVIDIFDLARFTRRIVGQNLFWAFAYNSAGIVLAITGVLNPIIAAGAMVLSSLSVIANSMRLSRFLENR